MKNKSIPSIRSNRRYGNELNESLDFMHKSSNTRTEDSMSSPGRIINF